jgi:signal transduction histidine kinase
MKRRLVLSNLVLVTVVLLALEVPLAIIYSRHEHDALNTSLQRDGGSLAALSEEIIEHPGDHNVGALAQRFSQGAGSAVVIQNRSGAALTPPEAADADPGLQDALRAARAGQSTSGEIDGLTFVAVPLGPTADAHGAVLVARSDESIDNRVRQFWLVLLAIGAGVLGGSLVVSSRLARWVIDPLRQLDDSAAKLGDGDLSARAQTEHGPPEIVALAATFNEMADRLDELVRSQRRFVADASHQLRSPITALRLRLENLSTDDPTQIASSRDAALQETARLTRLIDGLLALARAEAHRPQRQTVDITEALERRSEAWAPLAAEQGVALQVLPAPDADLTAVLVPDHLEQILDNLIDNALDATPAGGSVALSSRRNGSKVEIHVTDEGRGMTDEERDRAFDPFWRGSNGHSNGNTGLGLAIVDQLVRSSGGTINLERNPRGGIDAVVCLPVFS